MLSFDQFRAAINDGIVRRQEEPPSPERDAIIAQLQAMLLVLPLEAEDS